MYKLRNKCINYLTKCFLKYIHNIQEILNVRHFRSKFWDKFLKCPFLSKVPLQRARTQERHIPRLARNKNKLFSQLPKMFDIFRGKTVPSCICTLVLRKWSEGVLGSAEKAQQYLNPPTVQHWAVTTGSGHGCAWKPLAALQFWKPPAHKATPAQSPGVRCRCWSLGPIGKLGSCCLSQRGPSGFIQAKLPQHRKMPCKP